MASIPQEQYVEIQYAGQEIDPLASKLSVLERRFDAHIGKGGNVHAIATQQEAGFMSPDDKTKLDGVENGATQNSTDAFLLNRGNHQGEQPIESVTGLRQELDDALAGGSNYRGLFPSLAALEAAIPVAVAGNYADVDEGQGFNAVRYIWDESDSGWVSAGEGEPLTAPQVKALYESNPNTNPLTDERLARLNRAYDLTIALTSTSQLIALPTESLQENSLSVVAEYHAGTKLGGGVFRWEPTEAKSTHNGGTVIDPTRVWPTSWENTTQVDNWYEVKNTAGMGVWVRQDIADLKLEYFGVWIGLAAQECSGAWIAATRVAARTGRILELPDGLINVTRSSVIRASQIDFRSFRVSGTFRSSATVLYVSPDKAGSVVRTSGNPALEVFFDTNTSENMVSDGVGYLDVYGEEPYTFRCAIEMNLGGPSLPVRYTTGHYFSGAAVGYRASIGFIGSTPSSVANAIYANYSGPVTLDSWNASKCRSALLFRSASANHLWVKNSTWFYLSGSAIEFEIKEGFPPGNVHGSLENMIMEQMRGFFNTSASATLAQDGIRNKFFLRNVNREYCGRYGVLEGDFEYSGSPLGFIGDSDVTIDGNWTAGIAFGEKNLPVRDPGSIIDASVEVMTDGATQSAITDGKTRTPDSVDAIRRTISLAPNSARNVFVYGYVGYYSSLIDVTVFSGSRGASLEFRVSSPATDGGISSVTRIGNSLPGVTIDATGRNGPAEMALLQISNTTSQAVTIDLLIKDPTGRSVPVISAS